MISELARVLEQVAAINRQMDEGMAKIISRLDREIALAEAVQQKYSTNTAAILTD